MEGPPTLLSLGSWFLPGKSAAAGRRARITQLRKGKSHEAPELEQAHEREGERIVPLSRPGPGGLAAALRTQLLLEPQAIDTGWLLAGSAPRPPRDKPPPAERGSQELA